MLLKQGNLNEHNVVASTSHFLPCSPSLQICDFVQLQESNQSNNMESMEECPLNTKILVGVPLDAKASTELLAWAVEVATHSDDTITVLHVLVGKNERRLKYKTTKLLRQAKALVISMCGEFAEICQNKEVKLEAKVKISSSIGKGLVEEAASTKASFLVVGESRNKSQRKSFEVARYCFKHAPEGCLVIDIGKKDQPQNDADINSVPCEAVNRFSSTRWTKSPLHKLFGSKPKREKSSSKLHSTRESICEKSSPRTVLDGPEETNSVLEDCSCPLSNEISSPGHMNIWRRLSSIKLFLPFFRHSFDLSERDSDACSFNKEEQKPKWKCFSYEEISQATNDFHPDNMVGRGGYAEVFKGVLYNSQTIAVKRLGKDSKDEQKEKEFLTELGIMGHVSHPNTASLVGCCIENGFHLVFEFSPNGSLASALHSRNSKLLEWPVRYKIAIGIARGLHYLHKGCRRRIIHRDIKASNVLLGSDFEPQISDFGLAKWLPKQWSHHSVIPIEGTFGYLAPEYFMHGIVDEKTDIYAFGVLLLEIVTGRRPVDVTKQSLLLWAKPLIESGKIAQLADPRLEGRYDEDQLQRLVLISSYCMRQSSIWRPSMSEVLQLLTEDDGPEAAENWRMQESQNETDDCSVDLDCLFPY